MTTTPITAAGDMGLSRMSETIAHAKASETVKGLISKAKKKAEKEIEKHRK